jgi:hypothetical protein
MKSDLREGWMQHADAVLAEQIVAAVYEALAKRIPRAATVVAQARRPRRPPISDRSAKW